MVLVAYLTILMFQLLLVSKLARKYPQSPFFLVKASVKQNLPLLDILFCCRAAANIFFTTIKPIDGRGRLGPYSSVEL